jgi:hypothetical protein
MPPDDMMHASVPLLLRTARLCVSGSYMASATAHTMCATPYRAAVVGHRITGGTLSMFTWLRAAAARVRSPARCRHAMQRASIYSMPSTRRGRTPTCAAASRASSALSAGASPTTGRWCRLTHRRTCATRHCACSLSQRSARPSGCGSITAGRVAPRSPICSSARACASSPTADAGIIRARASRTGKGRGNCTRRTTIRRCGTSRTRLSARAVATGSSSPKRTSCVQGTIPGICSTRSSFAAPSRLSSRPAVCPTTCGAWPLPTCQRLAPRLAA